MTESDDLRAFIREIMALQRHGLDAVLAEQRVELRAVRAEQRAAREESRQYLDELHRKTDEVIAEGRAGRQALFAILDKLNGGGPTTATG